MRDVQLKYRRTLGRKDKSRIVKEVAENLRCHRKHAIRVLNGAAPRLERPWRQRDQVYPERLVRVLAEVWEATQYPWSDRLKAALPLWLPWAPERWKLGGKDRQLLLAMSPATMDRRLAPYKHKLSRRLYGKTKPGRPLRQRIPIQTSSWEVTEPGWSEVDTVSHSGPSAQGLFAYTVNATDLASGWTESDAVLGKGRKEVTSALDGIRQALPFEQKGLDSDNGEEFINWHLDSYCASTGLKRFRSRPNKKDDQAHIEQKNWTNVRKFVGWDRYDTPEAVAALRDLYRNELRLLCNLFLPSVKLRQKIRVGSKLKRVHDAAKTPLDRLIESGMGYRDRIEAYRKLRERLDPFELSRTVNRKLERIWSLASRGPVRAAKPPTYKVPWWARYPADDDHPPAFITPFRDVQINGIRKNAYRDDYFGTR